MFSAYFAILVFIGIGIFIGIAPVIFSLIFRKSPLDAIVKNAPYECGFPEFGDARMPIIFDLETAFLFPWAVSFHHIGHFGFWAMMVFLGILVVGFVYEWKLGALEWSN